MKESYRGQVEEAWIDLNQHMNMGYYLVVFDLATENYYRDLNIGGVSDLDDGHTIFSIESRLCYRKELRLGERFIIETQLLGFDHNKVHYLHKMMTEETRDIVSLNECMVINVDQTSRRSTAFTQSSLQALQAEQAQDQELTVDPWVGQSMRQIGWPDK